MRQLIYLFLAIILLSSCLDEDDNTVVLPFKNDTAPRVSVSQIPDTISLSGIPDQPVDSVTTLNATVRIVKVDMRDYAAQDGDIVSLYKNDSSGNPTPVVQNFNLANDTFNQKVELVNKGYNYLILVAENQAIGPNTASIRINGKVFEFLLTTAESKAFNVFVQ